MSAKILDGKALAKKIQTELKSEVEALRASTGKVPCFMNITVGHDPSAGSYGKSQKSAADFIGIDYRFSTLPAHITQKELLDQIHLLNEDLNIHGMMLHKPVPAGIDFQQAVNAIDPGKDIEGMNIANIGSIMLGRAKIIPATPAAAMALLLSTGVDIAGKNVVVIGRSEIFGKPIALLLLEKNATVTICHSHTSQAGCLIEHIKKADVVVVAIGKPGFVKGEWLREGAIIIDVGINAVNGKIVGDVEFDEAARMASFITPVPGGVGPVTAVMLMKNGIETFKDQLHLS